MKLILNIGTLCLMLCVVCVAQNERYRTAVDSQADGALVGFQCPSGELNQPRPNAKLQLGDVTKKALELPQPEYPRARMPAQISGNVKAEVVININTGRVVWARTLSGHPLLQNAVKNVVCRARLVPVNDVDGYVSGIITYRFGRRR